MKSLQILLELAYEKFSIHEKKYVYEIAAVNLSKIYFLKNAKKTCIPKNRDLNRDWINTESVMNIFIWFHWLAELQGKLPSHLDGNRL